MNPIESTSALPTLSKAYRHANTAELQSFVESMGYTLFKQVVTKTRRVERRGYQKHMLIFDHPSLDLGGERIQLMLINSHDGTSSLRVMLGVYRIVCANGLIVGSTLREYRVIHAHDNFLPRVYSAINDVIDQAAHVANTIKRLKDTIITAADQDNLFRAAFEYRFKQKVFSFTVPVPRVEDMGTELYRAFNRAQEVLLTGGGATAVIQAEEGLKISRLRKLTGIDSIVDANKFIWNEAIKLAA